MDWLSSKYNSPSSSGIRCLVVLVILLFGLLHSIKSNAQAPQKAFELASDFFYLKNQEIKLKSGLEYPFSKITAYDNIWIFESYSPKCFILVKKEDSFKIAGYSFNNTFLVNNEIPPPGMMCLEAIQEISLTDLEKSRRLKSFPERIDPLLRTKWGQDCFFNHACPTDYRGKCDHVAAGCVPVAMGQIMRYYGHFNKFILKEEFESDEYPNETVVLGNYNWDLMQNEPLCIDLEVSRFLFHLGVISKVLYSHDNTSTSTYNAWVAFGKMSYLEPIRLTRSSTEQNVWINTFYENISEYMPVYVAGSGHAFVCDGYDENGFFHFNLGWGGISDGYYPLIGTGSPFISEALAELRPHSLVRPPVNLRIKEGEECDSLVWDPHPFADVPPFKYRIYQDEKEFDETESTSYPTNVFDDGRHCIKISAWYVNGESRWIGPKEVYNEGHEVDIPDDELRKTMNLALGYDDDEAATHIPRTDELIDMDKIELNSVISDLGGIEYCKRLIKLEIKDNSGQKIDLEKLRHNTFLKVLNINNAELESSEYLSSFHELIRLSLSETNLPSTSFLSSTPDLLSLTIKKTTAPPLDSLINLERLEFLDLNNTGLQEADFIDHLDNLKDLNLSHNNLQEITLDNELSKLRFVNICNNNLEDMEFIEMLPSIVSLKLDDNHLANLELFESYITLENLSFYNNNLQRIKINHPQPELVRVNLSKNHISNIDRLVESAPNLIELDISQNEIADLWLNSIQLLEYLDLSENQLTNIENIQLNPSLKHLNMSGNWIGDFYPLTRNNYFKKIEFLALSNNPCSKESFYQFYPLFREQIDTVLLDVMYSPHSPAYPDPGREYSTTDSSIRLSWESDNSGSFNGFELLFGETGEMELLDDNLTSLSYDVNVDQNRRYQWQVIAHYQDTSYHSGVFDFRTFPPLELPFYDDFEEYQINNKISQSSPYWKTLNQDNYQSTDDGLIIGFRHFSGSQSLKIQGNTHLFIPFDNFHSGVLICSFALLIPETNIACIRLTEITGIQLEVFFKTNGQADVLINNKIESTFPYSRGKWIPVRFYLSGNKEKIYVTVDDKTNFTMNWKFPNSLVEIQNFEFSGEKSPNYPSDGFPLYYIDDLEIRELSPTYSPSKELIEDDILIFPNPVKDELNIHLYPQSGIKEIFLLNSRGQRIETISGISNENKFKIKTSGLPPGTYYLCYSDETRIAHKKLIITP